MILLDRLLVGGLRFVLDKVGTAVDAELDDPARLKEELLELELRHELGEITLAERDRREAEILRALRDTQGPVGGAISFGGGDRPEIEVSFGGDDED